MKSRLLVFSVVFAGLLAGRAQDKIPVLAAGNTVYSNVTVTAVTATDVFFSYSGGMGNAKLKDLSPDLQQHFNFDTAKAQAAEQKQAADKARYYDQLLHQPAAHPPDESIAFGQRATAHPAQAMWREDLPGALSQAQSDTKLVLLDFTGSDWCPWCIKFDHDVLSTPEFAAYASAKLELVRLDFPRNTPQDPALKQANQELAQKFRVNGFPTYILLTNTGHELGRQVGYLDGGPNAFIKELEEYTKR